MSQMSDLLDFDQNQFGDKSADYIMCSRKQPRMFAVRAT